jgi:hypothetical protein
LAKRAKYDMNAPLLSFLTEFENALAAMEPIPDGNWSCTRSVNYGRGIARMSLASRRADQTTARGQIALQGYRLADGTFCLKAHLQWQGTEEVRIRSIYSKPNLDWNV